MSNIFDTRRVNMNIIKFIESHQTLALGLLWLFLVASLICTVVMIVTFLKKGDERKDYIVKRSAFSALVVAIIFLILNMIWNIFFEKNSSIGFEDSPIIYIGILSISCNIFYLINAKKHR